MERAKKGDEVTPQCLKSLGIWINSQHILIGVFLRVCHNRFGFVLYNGEIDEMIENIKDYQTHSEGLGPGSL